ncbi:MAG TPA: site-2 protease family protein [Candidatus Paceibacterota bacterium]|nr:site-2 protease family protein [Candidatus Paceibacterota bacterium]
MSLVIFILILAALILVHELGHFSVAKFFGIKVEEFGIGFPPRLLYIRKGETVYSINLLFFGGFVKIFGEDAAEGKGNPRSFASKSRWIQAAVIVAGICMNILFAWLALSVGYMAGLPTSVDHEGFGTVTNSQVMVTAVLPNSPAQSAGLAPQDVIEKAQTSDASLDVRTLNTNMQAQVVRNFIADHGSQSVILTILRDGEEKTFLAKPVSGLVEGKMAIGVELDDVGVLKLSPPLALAQGAILTYGMTVSTAEGLGTFFWQIIRGAADFGSVAGPIGIASIGSQAVSQGFSDVVVLTALISINLAIINLLPIPGLDGGRLFIILIEGIIRRTINPRITNIITIGGMAALIILMLVVSYHDVLRLIG